MGKLEAILFISGFCGFTVGALWLNIYLQKKPLEIRKKRSLKKAIKSGELLYEGDQAYLPCMADYFLNN